MPAARSENAPAVVPGSGWQTEDRKAELPPVRPVGRAVGTKGVRKAKASVMAERKPGRSARDSAGTRKGSGQVGKSRTAGSGTARRRVRLLRKPFPRLTGPPPGNGPAMDPEREAPDEGARALWREHGAGRKAGPKCVLGWMDLTYAGLARKNIGGGTRGR